MQTVQGNLTILNAHTANLRVFWNGAEVTGLVDVRSDWDQDNPRVKVKVHGADPEIVAAMRAGGVIVKEV